jgi:hypothetical protein
MMDIGGMYQISLHVHLMSLNHKQALLIVAYGPDINKTLLYLLFSGKPENGN